MRKVMIMASRTVFIWAIMAVASSIVFASPSVSDVSYWQNPTSRLVKVTYTLSGESGVPLLDIRTNGISIGWSNLRGAYGDVHKVVSPGTGKTIWWNPNKAWPGHSLSSGVTAVVRVWPKNNPPDVMVVNCERQYEGRDDVVQYYASFEHLPEGTVNCDAYKTASKMAFITKFFMNRGIILTIAICSLFTFVAIFMLICFGLISAPMQLLITDKISSKL